jgi:hypothetical protein
MADMEIGVTERLNGFEEEVDELLEQLRQRYFWLHLVVDFTAGFCFVVGSAFFFYKSLVYAGTWLFLIGSIMFAAKPTVRLTHQLHRNRVRSGDGRSAARSAS